MQVAPPDGDAGHLFARWPHDSHPPATLNRVLPDEEGEQVVCHRRWLRRVQRRCAPAAAAALLRLPTLTVERAGSATKEALASSAFCRPRVGVPPPAACLCRSIYTLPVPFPSGAVLRTPQCACKGAVGLR